MLFFAIVYLVEGIGQARVGIIYQPLTHYLKETGWTALQVAAYFAVLNFPWVIKPVFGLVSDFVPLFGYRRKSYLIIASLCAVAGYAVIARQADPVAFALPLLLTAYAMASASTLCGALLAENGQAFRFSSSFVRIRRAIRSWIDLDCIGRFATCASLTCAWLIRWCGHFAPPLYIHEQGNTRAKVPIHAHRSLRGSLATVVRYRS